MPEGLLISLRVITNSGSGFPATSILIHCCGLLDSCWHVSNTTDSLMPSISDTSPLAPSSLGVNTFQSFKSLQTTCTRFFRAMLNWTSTLLHLRNHFQKFLDPAVVHREHVGQPPI